MPLHDRSRKAILPTYDRSPIIINRGESCYLFDENGTEYLDLTAGLGVNALGYAHPGIIEAVERQIRQYSHLSNLYVQEPQVELAERLLGFSTGFGGVFFCNSGAEAIEGAIKLARRWGGARGKKTLVGFAKGFHGRTTGALSIMTTEKYREGFGPFMDGVLHLPYNDPEALYNHIDENTAAVFLECIQGEGGVVPAAGEFITALTELRDRHGFLIVADEIQAGIGRTGKFFSFEWSGLQPDVVCIAKAAGGGLPLGALLVRENLRDVYGIGRHGSTFGGNPVACAAGCVVLDTIRDENVMERVLEVSGLIIERLRESQVRYPGLIADIRGRGFMIGIELREPVPAIRDLFAERRLLVNVTHGNVIRLLPPLILPEAEARRAMDIFDGVFGLVSSQ
jgi:acetylornithine aminotransferase